MEGPKELSLSEIRKYMLENGCKVTNHALVKHFKRFLTHPETQNEARKEFKTYVNILATIKNENNQKYLLLRKKYLNECPSDDVVQRAILQAGGVDSVPNSPGDVSLNSDMATGSPFRQPPPYKPPPEVSSSPAVTKVFEAPLATGVNVNAENVDNYRDCVTEFTNAMSRIDPKRLERQPSSGNETQTPTPQDDDNKIKALEDRANNEKSISRANSVDASANKENIPRFSFSSGSSATSTEGSGDKSSGPDVETENPISVKEATRKFNRMASEEEAKIISPPSKKKAEKQLIEEKELPEVTLGHPKAKEWIVSMAKANYQELAKLANEYPELVKLQDPSTGYTALHWAAKHGNEDVVKLIAGTYKADVNAQTNGGYTPLHIAMQFGRSNIFALLCNTYKANRDLLDWSGNKPLDYSKQQTSVSASTYSKIKAKRKPTAEKDSGFLRIGSLNVRVKKTTEAFSNFLGVGNGTGNAIQQHHYPPAASTVNHHHQRHHRHHHYPHHLHAPSGMMRNQQHLHPMMMKKSATITMTMKNQPSSSMNLPVAPGSRASVPINTTKYDILHKSWGSADNITQNGVSTTTRNQNDDDDEDDALMPPPTNVNKRQKNAKRSSFASNNTDSPRDSISSISSSNFNSGYSSMPTTPNQLRSPLGLGIPNNNSFTADSDSDSACGFNSNWSINGRTSLSSGNLKSPKY